LVVVAERYLPQPFPLLVRHLGQHVVLVPLQGQLAVDEEAVELAQGGQDLQFLGQGRLLGEQVQQLLTQRQQRVVHVVHDALHHPAAPARLAVHRPHLGRQQMPPLQAVDKVRQLQGFLVEPVARAGVHQLRHLQQFDELHVVLQRFAVAFVRVDEVVDAVAERGALLLQARQLAAQLARAFPELLVLCGREEAR